MRDEARRSTNVRTYLRTYVSSCDMIHREKLGRTMRNRRSAHSVAAGGAVASYTTRAGRAERDPHCWKTQRNPLGELPAGAAKIPRDRYRSLPAGCLLACLVGRSVGPRSADAHGTASRRDARPRPRERERKRGEHDTNRLVPELRPTCCDLGL